MRDKVLAYTLAISVGAHLAILIVVGTTSASRPADVEELKPVQVDLVKTPYEKPEPIPVEAARPMPEPVVPDRVSPQPAPVPQADFKLQAAALAVAIALAEQGQSSAHPLPDPPTAIVSAWQLGMRTSQRSEKGNFRRH